MNISKKIIKELQDIDLQRLQSDNERTRIIANCRLASLRTLLTPILIWQDMPPENESQMAEMAECMFQVRNRLRRLHADLFYYEEQHLMEGDLEKIT